jgi:hypothetical protein
MTNTFKENWNKVDEKCPYCNNVTKKVIGINKQNLKRLFTKPTLQDIIVFIMLIACLILTWSYYKDISQYKLILENPEDLCTSYFNQLLLKSNQGINTNNSVGNTNSLNIPDLNISILNISTNKNG